MARADAEEGGPLRVLHVIPAVAARYGGPSRAVLEMGRALVGRGLDVLIATTDADGGGHLAVERGQPGRLAGLPVIFFARQASESFKYSHGLAKWLRAHVADFDVVHIHAVLSHACLAAAGACRRCGVPYVIRPLGTLAPWSLGQKPRRKRLLLRVVAARALRCAAAIHYTSAAERRGTEASLGLARGVVIPLGVDEQLFEEPETPPRLAGSEDPYVLILSRLHEKKGLDLFLDVFLRLTASPGLGRWRLVVAGDGARGYVEGLKRLVRERRAEGRVIWTGWLDGDDRLAVLRGADLLALPSRQENFALAAVEAMACGVPVLISEQVDVADEVALAEAGWVAPLEPAGLARALEDALRSGPERKRRGQSGRLLAARRFRWADVAAELEALYARLARSTTAAPAAHP